MRRIPTHGGDGGSGGKLKRILVPLAGLLLILAVGVVAPQEADAAIGNVAIATSSFCDSGGTCIAQRIWLQKQCFSCPAGGDAVYEWRTYVRVNCSHSGVLVACRAITADEAGLDHNAGSGDVFDYIVHDDTCLSYTACGVGYHDAAGPWKVSAFGWTWDASGGWAGCPSTGTQCGSDPFFETGWRS